MPDTPPTSAATRISQSVLREMIDRAVDTNPLKLRDALLNVLIRVYAEAEGAGRQMEAGDYHLCPPDMMLVYVEDAIYAALVQPSGSDIRPEATNG